MVLELVLIKITGYFVSHGPECRLGLFSLINEALFSIIKNKKTRQNGDYS